MFGKWAATGAMVVACAAAAPAGAQEVYVKGGFLGAGVGYAHGLSDKFGVRADISTIGTISREETSSELRYDAKLKANQVGAYADWFPFSNGFRLTAGLNIRKLSIEGNGVSDGGTITIHDTTVAYGPDDQVKASVKFPSVAPYLGLGWGHNPTGKGWGFVVDAGLSFGKPKTNVFVNDSLYAKLDAAAQAGGSSADAEIAAQRNKIADDIDDFKVFPQLYVGVSYRF